MTLPMAVFGIPFPAQSSGFSVRKSKFENRLKENGELACICQFCDLIFFSGECFLHLSDPSSFSGTTLHIIIVHQALGFMPSYSIGILVSRKPLIY